MTTEGHIDVSNNNTNMFDLLGLQNLNRLPNNYNWQHGNPYYNRLGQSMITRNVPLPPEPPFKPRPLPKPEEHANGFVWVFPGGEGWAGKGWEGPAKRRPYGVFGFAAKIHDLHYHINRLAFPANDYGNTKSRRAKADFICRKMNEIAKSHLRIGGRILNPLASAFFIGVSQKEFCPNDGFINVINDKSLDNPYDYLMIPYTELSMKPTKVERIWNFPYYYDVSVPDLFQDVSDDYSRVKGWRTWAKLTYGSKWEKLKSINSKTGPNFKW